MKPERKKLWIVELEPGTQWLAPWRGDPGRTSVRLSARRFGSIHGARVALGLARRFRSLRNAAIKST